MDQNPGMTVQKDMTNEQAINRGANQGTGDFLLTCQQIVSDCDAQIDQHEQARAYLAGAIVALEVRRRAAATAADHILSAQEEGDDPPMPMPQLKPQPSWPEGMARGRGV